MSARTFHAAAVALTVLAAVAAGALAAVPWGLAVAAAGVAALTALARSTRPWKVVLVAFPFSLVLATLLAVTREGGAAVTLAGVTFHAQGFTEGVTAGARFAVVFAASVWAAGATRPGDALRLLRHTPRLALAVTSVARLAPALADDYRAVVEARRLRGALPAGRVARVAASGALLPPLLVRAARRGVATDEALRAAGYDATTRRVAYGRAPWRARDVALAVGAGAVATLALVAGRVT